MSRSNSHLATMPSGIYGSRIFNHLHFIRKSLTFHYTVTAFYLVWWDIATMNKRLPASEIHFNLNKCEMKNIFRKRRISSHRGITKKVKKTIKSLIMRYNKNEKQSYSRILNWLCSREPKFSFLKCSKPRSSYQEFISISISWSYTSGPRDFPNENMKQTSMPIYRVNGSR